MRASPVRVRMAQRTVMSGEESCDSRSGRGCGARCYGGRRTNGSFRDGCERAWAAGARYVRFIAFVAAIGGFLFGFDLGMIGAANIYLRDQFHLNDAQLGFATASAVLGCIFGPFLGGWLCDAIGRKRTMIVAAFLLAVSAVLTAVPDFLPGMPDSATLAVFNFFRAVGGLGVGSVLHRLAHVHRRSGAARTARRLGADVSTGDRRGAHRRSGDRLS